MSPFFIWAQVPFLGLVLWVPGLFLHGFLLFGIGLLVICMLIFGIRQPLAVAFLALLAGGFVLYDRWRIVHHTDESLASVQSYFGHVNNSLGMVHISPITLVPTGWPPTDYIGWGINVTLFAAVLLLVGGITELAGHVYSKELVSVMIGLPRCRFCHCRVSYAMDYCPGCGQRQVPGRPCIHCGQWMQDAWKFCPACGTDSPPDDASRRDLMVPLRK